jgi:hypothetical protein
VNQAQLVSYKGRSVTLNTGATFDSLNRMPLSGAQVGEYRTYSSDLANKLGLHVKLDPVPEQDMKCCDIMDAKATNDHILKLYPTLRSPPSSHDRPLSYFRSFRFRIPPKFVARGDKSLVVLGNYNNGRVQITAETVTTSLKD